MRNCIVVLAVLAVLPFAIASYSSPPFRCPDFTHDNATKCHRFKGVDYFWSHFEGYSYGQMYYVPPPFKCAYATIQSASGAACMRDLIGVSYFTSTDPISGQSYTSRFDYISPVKGEIYYNYNGVTSISRIIAQTNYGFVLIACSLANGTDSPLNAMILTYERRPDQSVVDDLLAKAGDAGLERSQFTKVSQENCDREIIKKSGVTVNIIFDDNDGSDDDNHSSDSDDNDD